MTNLPKLDLHVLPCYDRGITGKGIRVSILDDGIEYTHDDLKDNYVSWSYNNDVVLPLKKLITYCLKYHRLQKLATMQMTKISIRILDMMLKGAMLMGQDVPEK